MELNDHEYSGASIYADMSISSHLYFRVGINIDIGILGVPAATSLQRGSRSMNQTGQYLKLLS